MRVLVAWEDARYQALDPFVKRRLAAHAPARGVTPPEVVFHTSEGNGNFPRYVEHTWPRVRTAGMPTSKGRLDHLVCVADGDRLHECVPSVPRPTAARDQLDAWHADAEEKWQTHLRGLVGTGGAPATSVHGRILRWSKESLVLAGFDRAPVMQLVGIDKDNEVVREHLEQCAPAPASLAPASFTDAFRNPLKCLGDLRAALKLPPLKKNSLELEDALRSLASDHLDLVCSRVPDVDRLVDLLWTLTAPAPTPSTPTASPPAASGGREKNKKARDA